MMKPLLLKADVLLKLGQLEESRSLYNTVLQVEPDNEKARIVFEAAEDEEQRGQAREAVTGIIRDTHGAESLGQR